MNYNEAKQKLESPRKKDSKKIANNTWLHTIEGGYAVKLHETDIIKFYPKYAELYTGGWYTHTTKERLNTYSPALISQKNSIWYLADSSLFYEGVKIDYTGKTLKPKQPEANEKANKKIKKAIKTYADKFVTALKAGLDAPNGGDCWYCALVTEDKKSLGDATENSDHLTDHIKENYFVPSLAWNAVKEAGYQYPEIILGYDRETLKSGKYIIEESTHRAIVRYLQRRLLKRI